MSFKMTSLIFLSFAALAAGSSSFRGQPLREAPLGGGVEAGEVRAKLQEALDSVLAVGSAGPSSDLAAIKDKMLPTFQALPKASDNRLGPRAVHHILLSYFRKEHGWTLFGFAPPSDDVEGNLPKESRASAVLQDKVPAIMEAVLEAREHGQGLTLPEVVAVAAALERLILDESVQLLHMSYNMNGYDDEGSISRTMAHEVLVSYMALFSLPNKSGALTTTPAAHHRWKKQRRAAGKLAWEGEVAHDTLGNFDFERQGALNPFAAPSYDFETTCKVGDNIAKQYGRRQDEGCRAMREALEAHDVAGTGRVTLEAFHSVGSVSFFLLNEPAEKLREMGALDESDPQNTMVRIANYVLSPGNCNRNSNYYHACCINTCDTILNELEAKFMAPSVDPELLLSTLTYNMSSTADKDFNIATSPLLGPSSNSLKERLRTIAQKHGGSVPLHGKLFSTWLHFAFPRDCPLPAREVKTTSEQETAAMKQVAPAEWASDMDFIMPANDSSWTEDEDVSLFEDLKSVPRSSVFAGLRSALRMLAMVGACAGFLGISMQYFSDVRRALGISGYKSSKKDDDFLLPMRF